MWRGQRLAGAWHRPTAGSWHCSSSSFVSSLSIFPSLPLYPPFSFLLLFHLFPFFRFPLFYLVLLSLFLPFFSFFLFPIFFYSFLSSIFPFFSLAAICFLYILLNYYTATTAATHCSFRYPCSHMICDFQERLGNKDNGICCNQNVGQSEFLWYVSPSRLAHSSKALDHHSRPVFLRRFCRTLPNVRRVFEDVWLEPLCTRMSTSVCNC